MEEDFFYNKAGSITPPNKQNKKTYKARKRYNPYNCSQEKDD